MNDMTNNLPATREGFGDSTSLAILETATSAAASQAKAMVEARYIMALKRPRVWDQVRQDILRECHRPAFAHNKSAFYRKPIGDGVEGLGIRFTEVALRCMTNVLIETTTIFEDAQKEIVRVSVTDLEANVTYPMDVRVSKTVERSKPNSDGSFISVRKNSYNKDVYTIFANDDDLLNKRGALISKAQRTLALRLIPGDIQDEAEETIKRVRLDEAARDPDAERKKIADAFAELNVKASDLLAYLGHPLDKCSPQELVNLRGFYGAIRDGEATWAQVMENKAEAPKGDGKPPAGDTKPAIADDVFAASLKKWAELINKGKKTPDEIIATAQSKNTLTEAQVKAIREAAKPKEFDPAAALADVRSKAEAATLTDAEVAKAIGVKKLDAVTEEQYAKALAFIADPAGGAK